MITTRQNVSTYLPFLLQGVPLKVYFLYTISVHFFNLPLMRPRRQTFVIIFKLFLMPFNGIKFGLTVVAFVRRRRRGRGRRGLISLINFAQNRQEMALFGKTVRIGLGLSSIGSGRRIYFYKFLQRYSTISLVIHYQKLFFIV